MNSSIALTFPEFELKKYELSLFITYLFDLIYSIFILYNALAGCKSAAYSDSCLSRNYRENLSI